MDMMKIITTLLAASMMTGCVSTSGVNGPRGPKIVSSGHATESGQYAEVGIEFSSVGDFVAILSPSRWKSPVATGGSLSWVNPAAWSKDAGRTGRILMGEVVLIGGVAAAAAGGSGGGGGTTSTMTPVVPGSPPIVPGGTPSH